MVRIIDQTFVYNGWNRFLTVEIEAGHRTLSRTIEDHGPAVAVLPFDPERGIALLVKQIRPGVLFAGDAPSLLEVPAGLADHGSVEQSALAEVFEEVGVRLRHLVPVGSTYSMPSISSERVHLFLGEFCAADWVASGGGIALEDEEIEVVELPLRTLANMSEDGALRDMKTLLLVSILRLRRPDLFVTLDTNGVAPAR